MDSSSSLCDRYTLRDENVSIMRFYYKMRSIFWQPEEINFEPDREDYAAASPNHKRIYRMFLEFFAPGDGAITEQAMSFSSSAKRTDERAFLLAQLLNEQDHMITYTRAVKEVLPPDEQNDIFTAADDLPCVKAKVQWINKWIEADAPRAVKYMAGAFAEGTFFVALFALVFYFRRKNIFRNFITANQFILRDETLHRDFNIFMSRYIPVLYKDEEGCDSETALKIAREAYDIEIAHMNHILAVPVDSVEADEALGLTKPNITRYIQTLVNQILVLAGHPTLFEDERVDLPWMAEIGLMSKKNFYEDLVVEYSGLSVSDTIDRMKNTGDGAETADVSNPLENPDDVDF